MDVFYQGNYSFGASSERSVQCRKAVKDAKAGREETGNERLVMGS
jgi:hypothetical protein